jgi:hypothetical protein
MPVQILMRFLEAKPTTAAEPVWPTLDPVDRGEIVRLLARLIAKAVVQDEAEADKEVGDD